MNGRINLFSGKDTIKNQMIKEGHFSKNLNFFLTNFSLHPKFRTVYLLKKKICFVRNQTTIAMPKTTFTAFTTYFFIFNRGRTPRKTQEYLPTKTLKIFRKLSRNKICKNIR
jgi:hypothetical protein